MDSHGLVINGATYTMNCHISATRDGVPFWVSSKFSGQQGAFHFTVENRGSSYPRNGDPFTNIYHVISQKNVISILTVANKTNLSIQKQLHMIYARM